MVLNDTCKRFVQGIMERRFVIEEEAIALLNLITGCNSSTKSDLDKMIKKVNDGIKKCHVEIKQQICDLSSKNFLVFVSCLPSTSKDENFDKSCYAYSNTERDFFKSVLEEIITSEERCVRRNTALNLTVAGGSQSQSWGPHQYNQALLKFQEDGWLAALDEGKVYLGARAIAELEHMLLNEYKIESCKLCSSVCVRGFICDGCSIMTHFHCEQKFSERKRAQGNKCPTCESEMRAT